MVVVVSVVRCSAIIAAEDTTNAEVDVMHIRNNTNREAVFVMVGGAPVPTSSANINGLVGITVLRKWKKQTTESL